MFGRENSLSFVHDNQIRVERHDIEFGHVQTPFYWRK